MTTKTIAGVELWGWKCDGRLFLAAAHDDEARLVVVAAALETQGWTARVLDTGQGFFNLEAECRA